MTKNMVKNVNICPAALCTKCLAKCLYKEVMVREGAQLVLSSIF